MLSKHFSWTSGIRIALGRKFDQLKKLIMEASLPVAPATERNKEPILQVLQSVLPSGEMKILEIASGTGQHVTHFARALPNILWQPSEYSEHGVQTIEKYRNFYKLPNVLPALEIDVCQPPESWKLRTDNSSSSASLDGILCTNMIHISPWKCTEGLFSSAGYLLKPGGLLITYGPYAQNGLLVPESNVNFDKSLRSQNPEWGIRDIRDLIEVGKLYSMELKQTFDMPANNKMLIFQKM